MGLGLLRCKLLIGGVGYCVWAVCWWVATTNGELYRGGSVWLWEPVDNTVAIKIDPIAVESPDWTARLWDWVRAKHFTDLRTWCGALGFGGCEGGLGTESGTVVCRLVCGSSPKKKMFFLMFLNFWLGFYHKVALSFLCVTSWNYFVSFVVFLPQSCTKFCHKVALSFLCVTSVRHEACVLYKLNT